MFISRKEGLTGDDGTTSSERLSNLMKGSRRRRTVADLRNGDGRITRRTQSAHGHDAKHPRRELRGDHPSQQNLLAHETMTREINLGPIREGAERSEVPFSGRYHGSLLTPRRTYLRGNGKSEQPEGGTRMEIGQRQDALTRNHDRATERR